MNKLFSSDEHSSGLLEREEIGDSYKWNLNDIYEKDNLWEDDFALLEKKANELLLRLDQN